MGVVTWPRRFEVWLVSLDPTRGSEIRKSRPCMIVSPDEMNQQVRTVIIAPMTTATRPYPTRVGVRFGSKEGRVALDQIRAVDKLRLVRSLGTVPKATARRVCAVLVETFTDG
ncbi:MAG: type II toxin-antitoxin system PemK/MazF family toxin [Geminicoccaceae bacterium]